MPADMSMVMPPKKSGCAMGDGGAAGPSRGALSLATVIGALAIALYVARRAARRG